MKGDNARMTITDHPYLDNNGPTYMFGVCDHSTCDKRIRGHICPRRLCGKGVSEHTTMVRADSPRGRRRVIAVPL